MKWFLSYKITVCKKNVQEQEQSVTKQYLAALVVSLLTLGWGVTCGWISPNIVLLTSDDTPLPSGKITNDEASWVASLLSLGGLMGNILFGFVTKKFGRKKPLIFLSIPTIISWSLILFAQNIYFLYASRLLNGLVGGGLLSIIPLFLAEIASDNVRGVLGCTLILTAKLGIVSAFILGNYCSFYVTPIFVIVLTFLFAVAMVFFPESAPFLMKQNKVDEAENSFRFYRNLRGKDQNFELVQLELNKMESMYSASKGEETDNSLKWSDFTTGAGGKAMIIGIVLAALNQFSGCFAMLTYTASIFKGAGSNLSPNVAAIIVGSIQFVGAYVATILVDRAGRKILYLISTIGTATGLITLGVYMMLKSWHYKVETFNWVPIACFSFIIFIASWAIFSLPFLVISEIMPAKIKEFGVAFCATLLWLFAFIITKFLPVLIESLTFHGCMFLFSGVCLSSALFIAIRMPETKCKSYEEIADLLNNSNPKSLRWRTPAMFTKLFSNLNMNNCK